MRLQDVACYQPQAIVNRDLDGCPFLVAIVRLHKDQADVVYLDDGNVERRVPLEELSADEETTKELWNQARQKMWDDGLEELKDLQPDSDSELEQDSDDNDDTPSLPLEHEACKEAERAETRSEETESGDSVSEGLEEPSFEDDPDFEVEENSDVSGSPEVESDDEEEAEVDDFMECKVNSKEAVKDAEEHVGQPASPFHELDGKGLESPSRAEVPHVEIAKACIEPASDVEEDMAEEDNLIFACISTTCDDLASTSNSSEKNNEAAPTPLGESCSPTSACSKHLDDGESLAQPAAPQPHESETAPVCSSDMGDELITKPDFYQCQALSDVEDEFDSAIAGESPDLNKIDTDAKARINADKEIWFSELPIRYQMFVHYGLYGSLD